MSLDLVVVEARTLAVGQPTPEVKATWHAHDDLDLPWHYFAKQTGSLTVEVAELSVLRTPISWHELADVDIELVERLKAPDDGWEHPADGLTWNEATTAARRLGELHGIELRLPTEFEWERLARGNDDRIYPWGEVFDRDCCNLAEAGVGRTEPVGARGDGASEHGILDLAGNVDEWTATVYAPLPGAHWSVPRVESWATDPHVTKGGSFSHHRDLALARRRHGVYRPWSGAGFRVVAERP